MIFKLARKVRISLPDLINARVVGLATISISTALLGLRYLDQLQPLELFAYDHLVRLRPVEKKSDPRLLVVTITEEDIQRHAQWPFSDQLIAKVLSRLQALEPTVIGLDIYRDIPVEPGNAELITQLKQPNVITIQNIDTRTGTPAPPASSPEQIGFNNVLIDPDDVTRRNLLLAENDEGTLYSFSLRLAIAYLATQGISPEGSQQNPNYLQLGQSVFVPLQENSGGYERIDAHGYQILLNYRWSENIVRKVSLSQVLDGQIEPSWVKDKIVLIGSTAPSLKDLFKTPYSSVLQKNLDMPGVVIHAQMVSQLLDAATGERSLFWFWSEFTEGLWIFGWVLIGGTVGWVFRHPVTVALGVSIGLLVLWGSCFCIFTLAGWVPVASPALGFLITVGIVVTFQSHQDHQQQQMIMKLLGQNTSPQIADTLWRGRDYLLKSGKLPGLSLTATMFFTDIKNFSTISEKMTPEALLEWLNEFLEVLTHEVLEHQGIVNKFTGDGLIAAFGVPTPHKDKEKIAEDARAAVTCAMVISDRLNELNQNWLKRGLPNIQMRIGIFTGAIVAGSLGGKNRLEYGIIGDSVNIASRLESCEKHRQPSDCRILIGYETLVHLQEQFEVESWGLLALKGKERMVDVYRVVGWRSDKSS
ncbi:MAG: adenylate/guanylate cyclase domain-containing protein [Symploca sp. SIO2C1]|nr:adenylate/guanylate cyclase domain-containing protein [Symploca sp. SIO2C1]